MRCKLAFILVFCLIVIQFAGFASASYVVNDYYLQKGYETGQNIAGWVEISFSNHSSMDILNDSLGNSINILEFIQLNSAYNYSLNSSTNIISSGNGRLYINKANFSTTLNETSYIYNISINGEVIISENISLISRKSFVAIKIEEKKDDLDKVRVQIASYSLFIQGGLNAALNIYNIDKNLSNIELLYNSSSTSEEYSDLLNDLDSLNLPMLITETESADNIPFVSKKNIIDLGFIEEIGGGNYSLSMEDTYKDRIIFWNQENLNPKISYKKINALYENGEKSILGYFSISIDQRPYSSVFLVLDLNNVRFQQDYGEKQSEDYTYIDFSEAGDTIIFDTTEELKFDNLPFFISPRLTDISSEDLQPIINSEEESAISKWTLMVLVAILLIIIFVVAYILLKVWYDKKYENYLFKDKNQLYNLVTYITNANKNNVKKSDIEKNLKKAKWSNEQIRYIMRKYMGKRTGLWIPGKKESNSKNI